MNKQASLIFSISVSTVLSSLGCCYAQDSDVDAKMDAAKDAFYSGALAQGPLTSAIKRAEKPEAEAWAYIHEGKYHEAESLLLRALAIREKLLSPKHILVAITLDELAILYALEKKFDDAQTFAKRASAMWKDAPNPVSSDGADTKKLVITLNNLGVVYLNGGKNAEAEEIFREAINLDPKYRLPYDNRAIAREKQGDKQGAEEDRAKGRELSY